MPDPILQVSGVSKLFTLDGGQGAETAQVLKGLSFAVESGEIFAVIGPSGAGKTTLLRLLNALEEPSTGEVLFQSKSLRDWPVLELRRRIALLFQTPTMFPGTVLDNLMAPLRLRDGRAAQADRARLEDLLWGVGLDASYLERQAGTLSIGQQQRVAFARALVLRPCAILLDEPTASLDPATALQFLRQLSAFSRDQGLTAVLVTHQLEHARETADRVLLLIDGETVCIQPTDEFFAAPANERARRFINGEFAHSQ